MVAVFCALLIAVGTFILVYFPAQMSARATMSTEQRASAIAQVMSTAVGPALEFDDAENASSILSWLESMPDATFGVVRLADGSRLAAWRSSAIPSGQSWPSSPGIELGDGLMVVTMPIHALGGGRGTLHLGFSLDRLRAELGQIRGGVGVAAGIVVILGTLATILLARWLVRPLHRLTQTALKISRGELPAQLPEVTGSQEVARLADALRAMLERVNEVSQQELVRASRHAGMAEVATGVLHNVGNILTAVNVGVEVMRERTIAMPLDRLQRLHQLLVSSVAAGTLDGDRLAAAVRFVELVGKMLESHRATSLNDITALAGHVEHIKRVVAMQNAYARSGSVVEPARVASLIDEALEMALPAARRHGVVLTTDLLDQTVVIDRHRVLQIVVNLIANARDAVQASPRERKIHVGTKIVASTLRIEVVDSGVGISPAALEQIFSAGFTTKPHGHGYGLHSASLAARHLGGSLVVASEGLERGAVFTLIVPVVSAPEVGSHA